MRAGKKAVSCIPCAKRKVRCDVGQPCSNCKRRKNDVCTYPIAVQRVTASESNSEDSTQRIERLEEYIRNLGGDPHLAHQVIQGSYGDTRERDTRNSSTEATSSKVTTSRSHSDSNTLFPKRTEASIGMPAGLVEHNEEVKCIETPMWYSWLGAKKTETEPQVSSANPDVPPKPKSTESHCFSSLLDPIKGLDADFLLSLHPLPAEGLLLWKHFLKNVHPLIMIFFEWEVEVIISRASHDPAMLTPGDQALVLAIYFITTLSLSDEQCVELVHCRRKQLLERFQQAVEQSLLIAEFMVTSDRIVLQAFMLYLLTIRNLARPSAVHSLLGIASRIAERMGLHHDGDKLKVPIHRSEERRRMWWQLQHMECDMGLLIGNISMIIYADWDTKMPSNLEDRDLYPNLEALPAPRRGLTNISHCLWRYQILYMQRDARSSRGIPTKALPWMLSPSVSLAEKDAMIDICEATLGSQFLQYCEPLNPLHVHIQIGVRLFVLAARRVARQPALVNVKISEMSTGEREEFLGICRRCLEYWVLSEMTESLRGYKWHNENYFPWPGFVYTVLEAHHRFDTDAVEELWILIGKVYLHYPTLMTAFSRPDIASIARITIVAWQRHYLHLQQRYQQRYQQQLSGDIHPPEVPSWMQQLRQKLELPDIEATPEMARDLAVDVCELLPMDFDFDAIDWNFWENAHVGAEFV